MWRLNVKLTKVQLLRLPGRARPFIHCKRKFYTVTYTRKNYAAVEIHPDSKAINYSRTGPDGPSLENNNSTDVLRDI